MLGLLQNAEAVGHHLILFIHRDKNRPVFVPEYLLHFLPGILPGTGNKKVRPDFRVHLQHLAQKPQHALRISFLCSSNAQH